MSRYFQSNNNRKNPNMKKPVAPKVKTESNVTKPMQFNKLANEPKNKKPEEDLSAVPLVTVTKPEEKKFTQRSRLFCGNLPTEISQEEFKKIFEKYGEVSEVFLNTDKGYGFVRLDTRANAEKAKWELDGIQLKNRTIRVTNELLETAFSQFGPIERAVVITDERGRSTEKGIVEFARKASATKALQRIKDDVFLLTSSPRAIAAAPLEQEDAEDGMSEKLVNQTPQYFLEREGQPRFAQPGTFEHEFGLRWKALDEMERQQREQLDKTIFNAKAKLESEMEDAIHDHKTLMMKQDLMRRQEELQRLEDARRREMDRRKQLELAREDAQKKEIEKLAQRQEILRAQVEGHMTFGNPQKNLPATRNMPPRNDNDFRRGPPGPGNASADHFFKDAIAQELLSGGPPPGMNRPPPQFEEFPPPNQGRRTFNQGPGGYNGQGQQQRRAYGNNSSGFDNGGQKRRRY